MLTLMFDGREVQVQVQTRDIMDGGGRSERRGLIDLVAFYLH